MSLHNVHKPMTGVLLKIRTFVINVSRKPTIELKISVFKYFHGLNNVGLTTVSKDGPAISTNLKRPQEELPIKLASEN